MLSTILQYRDHIQTTNLGHSQAILIPLLEMDVPIFQSLEKVQRIQGKMLTEPHESDKLRRHLRCLTEDHRAASAKRNR